VHDVETALGAVSILVNNAGIALLRSVDEVTERDWDETLAVNLKSAFLLTQAVLPGMRARRWGRILNVSSTAAQVGGVVGAHYAASKAGMIGLTHAYASALAGENITVNAIAPALIETEMLTGPLKAHADRIPTGRFGTVEEVTDVAMALLRNAYVTGQTVQVNGGIYLT
jgi:3-oxoacyl-[acyl-carrier protein] reductase